MISLLLFVFLKVLISWASIDLIMHACSEASLVDDNIRPPVTIWLKKFFKMTSASSESEEPGFSGNRRLNELFAFEQAESSNNPVRCSTNPDKIKVNVGS